MCYGYKKVYYYCNIAEEKNQYAYFFNGFSVNELLCELLHKTNKSLGPSVNLQSNFLLIVEI